VFAGNLGKAQALEVILEVAENLLDLESFKIFLIGSGSLSNWLLEQKVKRGLINVELPGRFPMAAMPKIYDNAGGLIVSLRDNDIINYTVPSKIQSYLSAGKPIIGSLNGEGARVIRESGCGFVSKAECVKELESSIRNLYQLSDEEREKLGRNGLDYFHDNFDMDVQVEHLIEILTKNQNQNQNQNKSK
jgi:glycosyltransferase involved in cell wall biosynthesis